MILKNLKDEKLPDIQKHKHVENRKSPKRQNIHKYQIHPRNIHTNRDITESHFQLQIIFRKYTEYQRNVRIYTSSSMNAYFLLTALYISMIPFSGHVANLGQIDFGSLI